jgi:hypothetical protein
MQMPCKAAVTEQARIQPLCLEVRRVLGSYRELPESWLVEDWVAFNSTPKMEKGLGVFMVFSL